ncbi:alginate O-acetyltransferase [Methylocystis sp. IM3]|uniref:alginate O-acetyltransferase AlgX-related protein n=2 Tax=Methylocystis TaxID=133 RepID=UPI0030F87D15
MTRARLLYVQRLPILGCAGFLFALLLVNAWNLAVSTDWPKLRIRSSQPLWGVVPPQPAPWSVSAFLAGETQKAVSSSVGQLQPVFPLAVRIRNQFLFSVLGVSGAPDIVIGRERHLFEKYYIDEFCARGAAPDPAAVDAWASRIRGIQDAAGAKGKAFVYLISPSKAPLYSRYLPEKISCPALARGSTDKLAPYLAALDARGVAYIDGASLSRAAAPDYAIDLFPPGGTHWNVLGAAIATRAFTQRLNEGKATALPAYDFDWRKRDEAAGADIDLLRLLNLLWSDWRYPSAAVTGRSARACDKPPRLFAVGGSFLIEALIDLADAPCGAQIDYWHYMKGARPGESLRWRRLANRAEDFNQPIDDTIAKDSEFQRGFAASEVVLLEENEAVIGEMGQVPDLLAAATR